MHEEKKASHLPYEPLVPRLSIAEDGYEDQKTLLGQVISKQVNENLQLRFNTIAGKITRLTLIAHDLELINYLQGWKPFLFENMTPSQIIQKKKDVETWVRGQLSVIDEQAGDYHTITFNWVDHTSKISSLQAYLFPAAVEGIFPGYGKGIVAPTVPPQPPPPSL